MKYLKYFIALLVFVPNIVNAQVVMRTNLYNPMTFVEDSAIQDPWAAWGTGSINPFGGSDPWIYDIGIQKNTSGTGTFLNIEAEYYVGFAFRTQAMKFLNNYLESQLNTMKADNLRCGLGNSYGTGYDSTYVPTSTVEIALNGGVNPTSTYNHDQIVIKFKYTQEINNINYNGNVSCWFERDPQDGLAFQWGSVDSSDYEVSTYIKKFNVNISKSQDTILLEQINQINEDIKKNQETIIHQNTQIIDNINNLNSSINNSSVDNPSSQFDLLNGLVVENGVISSLLTMPITLYQNILNSVSRSCTAISLGTLFGTELIMPCINLESYLGSSLWSIIDVLISGLFIYFVSRKMIKTFNKLSSLGEGDVLND